MNVRLCRCFVWYLHTPISFIIALPSRCFGEDLLECCYKTFLYGLVDHEVIGHNQLLHRELMPFAQIEAAAMV